MVRCACACVPFRIPLFEILAWYPHSIPLHNSPHCCPACHTIADEFADHHVGCDGNEDRITRHNAIRDVLFSAAQSAALSPTRETNGLIPQSMSRPAYIYLAWRSTSSPRCPCYLATPTIYCTPGHALHVGTQRKLDRRSSTALPLSWSDIYSIGCRIARRPV